MEIYLRNKHKNQKFTNKIFAREFLSTLEVPNGTNAQQNAWLTITINYELNFIDSRNPSSKVTLRNGKGYIRDLDNIEFAVRDWDLSSRSDFVRRFNKGEDFWNYKFLLITPRNYEGLDFDCITKGVACRPNVICLFRLKSGGSPNHLTVDVVRPEDPTSFWDHYVMRKTFRSSQNTYKEGDAQTETLWHELGHALDQLHIRALKGDAQCMVDINAPRCYDGDNIMGRGTELEPINAKPWWELIAEHTEVAKTQWTPTMAVNTPPRSIPLGVALVGKPRF